jgi:hypothetical protein
MESKIPQVTKCYVSKLIFVGPAHAFSAANTHYSWSAAHANRTVASSLPDNFLDSHMSKDPTKSVPQLVSFFLDPLLLFCKYIEISLSN